MASKYGKETYKKVTIRSNETTPLEVFNGAGTALMSLSSAGALTTAAGISQGTETITSTSASALAVGRQGATDPVLKVDASTASVATGVSITGAAAVGGVAVAAISSGADEALTINAKGTGTIGIGSVSTGAVTITPATTISGALNYRRQVTDTGGAFAVPIVLTAAQSGRVLLCDDAAGLDFTLPAIGASDIGIFFDFFVTVTITSNSYRMTAGAADLLFGSVWISDFDTANTGTYFTADGTDDLIFTMNGSTTGGKKGSWVRFTATSATQWFVQGVVFGDGALATPFS